MKTKRRLYWIIFISLTVFFFLILSIIGSIYDFYPLGNLKTSIRIISLALILISIISHILKKILISETIKPLDEFINYVQSTISNNPKLKDIDEDNKEKVLKMLKDQGYDSEEIEKGLNDILENHNMRREFSANVSHELKSPLTSINGYAEMIAAGMTSDEDSREFARRINVEGNRLLRMIDETIQLSKLDTSYIKSDSLTQFDIGEMIQENIESFSVQLKEKNMIINYEYKELIFFGNAKLIFDLIRNLISNSIKYSSDKNPYLNIKTEDKMDKIRIYFSDNGIGISKENQERVFERFYVVDKSRGNKTGTGLGLSLAKNIAIFHKGKIELESEIGRGSTFMVELPKLSQEDYLN